MLQHPVMKNVEHESENVTKCASLSADALRCLHCLPTQTNSFPLWLNITLSNTYCFVSCYGSLPNVNVVLWSEGHMLLPCASDGPDTVPKSPIQPSQCQI